MPGFLIPLAGLALGALGKLVSRRRQARAMQGTRGAAFGSAINTQPQGPPTNAVSQAATTSPTPPGRGIGKAPAAQGPTVATPATGPVQQAPTAQQAPSAPAEDLSGLGARMGAESKRRDRMKNIAQRLRLQGGETGPGARLEDRFGAERAAEIRGGSEQRRRRKQASLAGAAIS